VTTLEGGSEVNANHLEQAREAMQCSRNGASIEDATLKAQWAIAHALIAIAERLPRPLVWRCCECKHEWLESQWPSDGMAACPKCQSLKTRWVNDCSQLCREKDCRYHPDYGPQPTE
jgi:hypothetical protein